MRSAAARERSASAVVIRRCVRTPAARKRRRGRHANAPFAPRSRARHAGPNLGGMCAGAARGHCRHGWRSAGRGLSRCIWYSAAKQRPATLGISAVAAANKDSAGSALSVGRRAKSRAGAVAASLHAFARRRSAMVCTRRC